MTSPAIPAADTGLPKIDPLDAGVAFVEITLQLSRVSILFEALEILMGRDDSDPALGVLFDNVVLRVKAAENLAATFISREAEVEHTRREATA